jgi:hypothetical protein
MHQNNIFFIFKKIFLRSTYQNDPKHTKKINFFQNTGTTVFPNAHFKKKRPSCYYIVIYIYALQLQMNLDIKN